MSTLSEFFIADHRSAVAHAHALDAGKTPPTQLSRLEVPDLTDLDVEILAELAVKAVHATGTDCELGLVDIELDTLFVVPEAVAVVFAELKDLEDQDDVTALAAAWAQTEEMSTTADVTEPVVRALSELASGADEDAMISLYFWSE
ncbi:hypothetical protein [Paenarthrobacter sp. PH39-S1]|uniref:hypothetical protein n=1 Tax=Micrococcaceae TaxID=1268 RepID=UPI0024BBA759|nr:hypothetical protein [Paenarthrobacter sp. PH39-S1]MDJ0357578.1 hypothetical protein [Paenarthrobacter sp. PH39-S1]